MEKLKASSAFQVFGVLLVCGAAELGIAPKMVGSRFAVFVFWGAGEVSVLHSDAVRQIGCAGR